MESKTNKITQRNVIIREKHHLQSIRFTIIDEVISSKIIVHWKIDFTKLN